MLTIGIDRGDQLRKGHAALTGDLLQTVPELVFEADARLVAGNDNRALRNRRLHGFSPANQPSVPYDRMALRARNPPAWCHRGFPAEVVSPSAVWSRVTCHGDRGIGNDAHNRDVRQNLLAQPDIADLSKQVELAPFYDAKLDAAAM